MGWKKSLKQLIPPTILNNTFLTFPFLYRMPIIRYETNMSETAVQELLRQLQLTLHLEGQIAECSSSRCGGSILMANSIREQHVSKKIFAFDSFEGFDLVELHGERKLGLTSAQQLRLPATGCLCRSSSTLTPSGLVNGGRSLAVF